MKLTRNPLLLVATLALSIVALEGGLRALDISFPVLHQRDWDRGIAGIPGAEGWWTTEGRGFVKMNRDGFHDRDHAVNKAPHTLRIIVVGDSFTEAKEVMRADRFTEILERELNACPALSGRRVEVLNFGIGGVGNVQALMALRQKGWKYRPDAVVLAFYTGNDVQENFRPLGNEPIGRPYAALRDGELVIDMSFRDDPAFRAKAASKWRKRLRRVINASAILQAVNRIRGLILTGGLGAAPKIPARHELPPSYAPPRDEVWKKAWQTTEAVLRQLRDEAGRNAASFWITVISYPPIVHPDAIRGLIPGAKGERAADYYPEARIAAFARREGIPVISLLEPFRAAAGRTGRPLHGFPNAIPGDGHWNRGGNRVAGQAMARRMCAEAGRLTGTPGRRP